jgi:hypothetical protein
MITVSPLLVTHGGLTLLLRAGVTANTPAHFRVAYDRTATRDIMHPHSRFSIPEH